MRFSSTTSVFKLILFSEIDMSQCIKFEAVFLPLVWCKQDNSASNYSGKPTIRLNHHVKTAHWKVITFFGNGRRIKKRCLKCCISWTSCTCSLIQNCNVTIMHQLHWVWEGTNMFFIINPCFPTGMLNFLWS